MMEPSEILNSERNSAEQTVVEVMREELRQETSSQRKKRRSNDLNKRRTILERQLNIEDPWNREKVVAKAEELKKKPLPISDYRQLQNALIQQEDNIDVFLSVDRVIPALMRDLLSSNSQILFAAAHCCCNIALGNRKRCTTLGKYLGPRIVDQLNTSNKPLQEVYAWTIGNLCSGSKEAFSVLHAQGCLRHLLSLLRECDTTILPSIMYSLTHYLYRGSEVLSESEATGMTKTLIDRECYNSSCGLWLLALLSSNSACTQALVTVLPAIVNCLATEMNEDSPTTGFITAAIRVIANVTSEHSGQAADGFLNHPVKSIQEIFEKLLTNPHIHIRRECLWLIGNLYNHEQTRISNAAVNLITSLSCIEYAITSISC